MVAIGSEEVCSETMAFVENDKDEEEKKMNGAALASVTLIAK